MSKFSYQCLKFYVTQKKDWSFAQQDDANRPYSVEHKSCITDSFGDTKTRRARTV